MGIGGGRTDCLRIHTEANRGRDVGHDKRRNWIRGQVLGQVNGEHIRLGLRGNDNRGITISNRINMVNNKQQTAVDWFLDKLLKDGYIKRLPVLEFQQAKKMEKQQLGSAWFDGATNWDAETHFEHYYKETYEKQ
jgi:hypothetical protein